jgi:hypothetical protein
MNVKREQSGEFRLELSRVELGTLGNCLNEVCNGLDVPQFETRVGVSVEVVRQMLKQIVQAYRSAGG